MQRKDQKTYEDGAVVRGLDALLATRLTVPWEYTVLAGALHPDDPYHTYVLLQLHWAGPDEYAVYRVDGEDGSCHGGQYTTAAAVGWFLYHERVAGAMGALARADRGIVTYGGSRARPAEPASLSPGELSGEDRELLGRVVAFMEDAGSITDGERRALLEEVLDRAGLSGE